MEVIFYCSESLWFVEFLHEFQDTDEMIYLICFASFLIFLTAQIQVFCQRISVFFLLQKLPCYVYVFWTLHWQFTVCAGHALFWQHFCQKNICFSWCHVSSCFSPNPCLYLLTVHLSHVKGYTDLQKCFSSELQRPFAVPHVVLILM